MPHFDSVFTLKGHACGEMHADGCDTTYSHVGSLEVESLEAMKHHRQEKGQVLVLSVQVHFCFGAVYKN